MIQHGECDDARVFVGLDTAAFIGDFKMLGLLVAAGFDPNQVNDANESASGILKHCHGLTLEEALAIDPVNGDDAKFPAGMEIVTKDQAKAALNNKLRGGGATLDRAWLSKLLRNMNFEQVLGHRFNAFCDLIFHRMDVERHLHELKPKHMHPAFRMVYTLHQVHLFKGLVQEKKS